MSSPSGGGRGMVVVGVVAIWWWSTRGGEDGECEMKDLKKFLRCACVHMFVYLIISAYSTFNFS